MVGNRPNHPEKAMIKLLKQQGFKEGKTKKTYVKWKKRSLKRQIPETGDFYSNCIWGPFKGSGPVEMDISFPESKLDLEIDGSTFHREQERDAKRDAALRGNGWTVIRITDYQVYRVFVPLLGGKP